MENKKQLVLDAFNNKETARVPVGFWFHHTKNQRLSAYEHPEMREQNLSGNKNFFEKFKPDFVKIMSDGYFLEPKTSEFLKNAKSAADLYELKPIDDSDKWILDQVSLVKELVSSFGGEVLAFYNIFAPLMSFKWSIENGDKKIAEFIKEDKFAVIYALDVISQNTQKLVNAVFSEGKVDGIYLSVQSVQDISVGPDTYHEVVSPSELAVLTAANSLSRTNILHVCGYQGKRNNLENYKNYPAKVINFASVVEGVTLEKGKKIFKDKAVIGGFDNTVDGVLYKETKEEVQAETRRLLQNAGRKGIILGADCTVPPDIDIERLEWVREAAK